MPEKFPYNYNRAYNESKIIEKILENNDAKDYDEADQKVEAKIKKHVDTYKKALKLGAFFLAKNGREKFSIPDEDFFVDEIFESAKVGIMKFAEKVSDSNNYKHNPVDDLMIMKDYFKIPDENFPVQILKDLVYQKPFRLFVSNNENKIAELIKISKGEQKELALKSIPELISRNNIERVFQLEEEFGFSKDIYEREQLKTAMEEILNDKLYRGMFDEALGIKEAFNYSDEKFFERAKWALWALIVENKKVNYAVENLIKKFSFSEKEVSEAIENAIGWRISQGDLEVAIKMCEDLSCSEEMFKDSKFQEAANKGFSAFLSQGNIEKAINITKIFNLPKEIVQKTAKDEFMKLLLDGFSLHKAEAIRENIPFDISSQEIIEKIQEYNFKLLFKLQKISPEFYNQILKSVDLLLSLYKYLENPDELLNAIQENPFLISAISENPRFGSKLLAKYPQFDESSKENIKNLINFKKEILANQSVDPESVEFRQAMQKKLERYKNNPEIVRKLQEQRININEWLNYSETQYFNLESGDSHLAFSETVSAPIQRIKETIDSYAHTLKEVLKQYRPELLEFKIPLEDAKEIEIKISKMQIELEKAKTEGNEKKAQGIEKGIEALKKKLENIKTVALWDKLLGDISAFQQLKNDVFQAQENLMKAEKYLQEKLSGKMPSGRMIQELKEKISKSKEELRSKFGVLEKRIDYFKDHLWTTVSPCLGDDTTGALMQEIQTNLAEQFDHYDEDRSTLSNLFSEKTDREKGKMENQPMSIFVWARNPDVDLYQGNYSPCCIRIDSEHMGAESTIADYNTDLGIQIVNIWDETKNEPVTAAWCWIGKNSEGETALVVDNIESNTQYSANYSEQLSKELFDYLKDYAKSIGVKKIVLGKANNDLPTSGELAKMKDDASKYEKVGGYNRPDGYFLEAEDKTVKLLWENMEPIEKVMQKVEKVAKVEFKNLNIKNLSEKDFEKIKKLEKKIYKDTGLALGQAMIEDMKSGNGLEYSIIASGKRPEGKRNESVGYLVALEDKTDEGDSCVYLEDIALLPEAQGQQIGWDMMKNLIAKLKEKAKKENKPVLLDMHLRETSQRFFERYHNELEQMGVKLLEEALVPDYYDEGEDSLYKVYQIKADLKTSSDIAKTVKGR